MAKKKATAKLKSSEASVTKTPAKSVSTQRKAAADNVAAAIQLSGKPEPVKVSTAKAQLPGISHQPTGPEESWRQSLAARVTAFEHMTPAYMLDDNFFFLDWNPAFDELFAKPLKIKRRTTHGGDFIAELVNPVAILKRATQVFDKEPKPLVDVESLQLISKKYGKLDFRKVAVQVTDDDARVTAWTVYLNIESCERADLLWADLERRLESELNWSQYAVSYDKLLLNFPEYQNLLDGLVARVSGRQRCLDLGAGTGNATLRLLQSDERREVCAVEPNHAMAKQLISKVEQLENSTSSSYFSRVQILKESILRLDEFSRIVRPGSYDAALMMNVLYAVDDPQKCLQRVAALLKPGGVLVLSTSHRDTSVDNLFATLAASLKAKGLFEQLRTNFDDARARHEEMTASIHRDTKADIRSFVEKAGFKITEWCDSAYAGAVVIVQAEKL